MNRFSVQKNTPSSGFSLIEVLVALAIFTFVSVAALGALLVMIDSNRKAQNLQAVMTNLSFALDSMTREIRTGRDYYCRNAIPTSVMNTANSNTRDCGSGSGFRSIAFNEAGSSIVSLAGCSDANNRRIAYRYNNNDAIERKICNNGWERITSPEVEVLDAQFFVTGTTPGDNQTPLVTIYIKGRAGGVGEDTSAEFAVQTTIAQYGLDL